MGDLPYTLPDEDPFNVTPLFAQPQRRRSSMLNQWVHQQHSVPPSDYLDPHLDPPLLPTAATRTNSNPYLAYPDMSRLHVARDGAQESTVSLNSYDFVDDEDIPANVQPPVCLFSTISFVS